MALSTLDGDELTVWMAELQTLIWLEGNIDKMNPRSADFIYSTGLWSAVLYIFLNTIVKRRPYVFQKMKNLAVIA